MTDVAAAVALGTANVAFLAVNNVVIVLTVVGVVNLWAQSGTKGPLLV